MRLLQYNEGQLSLTQDFGDDPPHYAVLSHVWGAEEVTFSDLMNGTAKSKTGYRKILFCGEQAKCDDLQYFWIDTCCIDKSNDIEVQKTINSMFRWYQNAAKCYVYLPDVSIIKRKEHDGPPGFTWESAFRASRWFTRGWTLQELLAPNSVEFFSKECKRLGDKRTLEQQIHEITGISVRALRGIPLSGFGVDERWLWAKNRQTMREEDKAYSLLGIFDVHISLDYGEGSDKAFARLRKAVGKSEKEFDRQYNYQDTVLDRLRSAYNAAFDFYDEENNVRCLQGTRVEVLRQIDTWASDVSSECIFLLNGMAGTGKSTISRTVAQNLANKGHLGASFFFKSGEGDRSHAGLFIAAIATQLVQKSPSLATHIHNAIGADPNISGKALKQQFEALVLQPLNKITNIQRPSIIVIVVDALNECDREEDVKIIIHLFSQVKHSASVQLKFFLTSKPELPIRLGFEDISGMYKILDLDQIPEPIVKQDISTFLEHELVMIRNDYNKSVFLNRQLPADWPGQVTVQILVGMAVPWFIFATTVCRFISDRRCGQPKHLLAKVLKYETTSKVSKLDAIYLAVLDQLLDRVTVSEKPCIVEEFQQVVGSIVMLASPLSATSLDLLLGVPEGTVHNRIALLHSVLSIPFNPTHPIRLFHLSFRDFLIDTEKSEINPFWISKKDIHAKLATICLQRLSSSSHMKKDIYDFGEPEGLHAIIGRKILDTHLTPDIQYASGYWVHHLKNSEGNICDDGPVHIFLKSHFHNWLQTLSLIGRFHESIGMIDSLLAIVKLTESTELSQLLYNAKYSVLLYCSKVDSSALSFAPRESDFQNTFQNENGPLDLISQSPNTNFFTIQSYKDYSDLFSLDALPHELKLFPVPLCDVADKVSNADTNSPQQALDGHSGGVNLVAPDNSSKYTGDGADGSMDGDERNPPKRLKKTHPTSHENPASLRLACPFRKHSPVRFTGIRWRACGGPGFASIARLKEHLYRVHKAPTHCERCWRQFKDDKELRRHLLEYNSCKIQAGKPPEGITIGIEKLLRKKKNSFSDEKKWVEIYQLIFPDSQEIPSPYFDEEVLASPNSRTLVEFKEYLRQELPIVVGSRLANLTSNGASPIEERLKKQIILAVKDSQDQVFASFGDQLVSGSSTPRPSSDSTGMQTLAMEGPAMPESYCHTDPEDQSSAINIPHLSNETYFNLYSLDFTLDFTEGEEMPSFQG